MMKSHSEFNIYHKRTSHNPLKFKWTIINFPCKTAFKSPIIAQDLNQYTYKEPHRKNDSIIMKPFKQRGGKERRSTHYFSSGSFVSESFPSNSEPTKSRITMCDLVNEGDSFNSILKRIQHYKLYRQCLMIQSIEQKMSQQKKKRIIRN